MISRLGILLLIVAGAMLHGVAAAQSIDDALRAGQRLPATGARMMALGGAGVSGIADYGALYRNPAGLGYSKHSSFFLAMQLQSIEDASSSTTTGFTADQRSGSLTPMRLSGLGVVYRVPTRRGSLVLAGGFNQVQSFDRFLQFGGINDESTVATSFLPFDSEYRLSGSNLILADFPYIGYVAGLFAPDGETLRDNPETYPFLEAVQAGTELDQFGDVQESGRLNEINLGGAIEFSEGVMLGVSANMVAGSYAFTSLFSEEDIYNQNTSDDYSLTLEDGSVVEGFHRLEYNQFLDSDFVGFGARIGLSGAAVGRFRWGATFESPTFFNVQEAYSLRLETQFDTGDALAYTSADGDEGDGVFDYDLRTPARMSVGLGYHANWATILFDVEWVDWKTMRFFANSDGDFFSDLNASIRRELKSVTNTRFGIEVPLGRFVVRAGRSTRLHPYKGSIPGSTGAALDLDRKYRSIGLAFNVNNRMVLEASAISTRYESVYRPYPEDAEGARQDITLSIDETIDDRFFVFGAKYRF